MFENFQSLRYRGTIIIGPWTPLLSGLFSVPSAMCFVVAAQHGGIAISGDNFMCVTT
jgi:hypothetical protein